MNRTKSFSADDVRDALKRVKFPGFSRDIVSFGLVKDIQITDNAVAVQMAVTTQHPEVANQIKTDSECVLRELGFVRATVTIATQSPQPSTAPSLQPASPTALPRIAGVKKVIAVTSAKGGVGKSTVAVNLACALQKLGHTVGLMDVDIYGPSVPQMLKLDEEPDVVADERLKPARASGLKIMSMGYLVDPGKASVLRGPMVGKYVNLFTLKVNWAPLDVLLVDMPPGTGDAHLSLAQSIALDGGVVVTTPQEVAVGVTQRGIVMMQTIHIPVLGLIENMSYYVCDHCGQRTDIFGHGGGRAQAQQLGVPFLGEIPIYSEIRESGDLGFPIVLAQPDSEPAQAFLRVAEQLQKKL
jgi:ATP-binding protein involved in chromosome partitioning